jgi:hypothetical protein
MTAKSLTVRTRSRQIHVGPGIAGHDELGDTLPMDPRAIGALALGAGLILGGGGATLFLGRAPAAVKPEAGVSAPVEAPDVDDDDALLAANANLVSSLQECNRRLSASGQKPLPPSAPSPAPAASVNRRNRQRQELTSADWERLAKQGAVPYSVPCIRDTPFAPSAKQLDRLGLAPQDGEILKEAYAKSNERVMAQLKPLCARVLGSEQLPDKVGATACMSAIIDSSRKESPDKMKDALGRVGEVNAGKRPPPKSNEAVEPVEALMLAFSAESKAFETDLAAKLGPEDAHRIATSRGLCVERGTVRARSEAQE